MPRNYWNISIYEKITELRKQGKIRKEICEILEISQKNYTISSHDTIRNNE